MALKEEKYKRKNVVLIADDDNTSSRILSHFVQKMGYQPVMAVDGEECIRYIEEHSPDVILLDINMPKKDGFDVMLHMKAHNIVTPVIMVTASHDIPQVVKCIKLGAFEFLTKPLSIDRLDIVMRNALSQSALQDKVKQLEEVIVTQPLFQRIVGESDAIKQAIEQVKKVMKTDLNVLILGESGTGKELFAQAIHEGSRRSKGPFVPVNCAAISNNLADSILFGHAKGSFTGAHSDHVGLFEQADNGTIFLDEIGDMDSDTQAKVLRVLEERKIRRVGEKTERSVNFRVISATNRDFSHAIQNSQFRVDLYFRLEEFTLFISPLRERTEDIPLIARHFLGEFASANDIKILQFGPNAFDTLAGYQWPGNIRELKNAVRRSAVTRKGDIIERLFVGIVPGSAQKQALDRRVALPVTEVPQHEERNENGSAVAYTLEEHERDAIIKAYKVSHGNLTRTARLLGIGRATLYRKLDKFGLEYLKTG
ncbi:MAG: sigma-54 dependent transcriptional regulator [Chlorobiaceae bacterium]